MVSTSKLESDFMLAAEAGRALKLSGPWIRHLCETGQLAFFRGGTGPRAPYVISRASVARLASERAQQINE
jgi:hypothetical protein